MNKKIISFMFLLLSFLFVSSVQAKELLRDEFIEQQLLDREIPVPQTNLNYNYESIESVKIKLKLVSGTISTKKDNIYDGMPLRFVVTNHPKYKGKVVVRQGTPVNAKVSIYKKRSMNGTPASILIDDFDIPGLPDGKILGVYQKVGQDRTLWLLPMKWALTILWPSGYFVNFIKGGNATFSDKDIITLEYFPAWIDSSITQVQNVDVLN